MFSESISDAFHPRDFLIPRDLTPGRHARVAEKRARSRPPKTLEIDRRQVAGARKHSSVDSSVDALRIDL